MSDAKASTEAYERVAGNGDTSRVVGLIHVHDNGREYVVKRLWGTKDVFVSDDAARAEEAMMNATTCND